jgi:thiol-disulfide isomerase/thioredoxin
MKRTLILVVVTLVLVGSSVFGVSYLRNSQEAKEQNEEAAQMKPVDTALEPSRPPEGTYVGYSEPALDSTSGRRVLFFHAPWCPQCRMIEKDIKEDGVPAGITVFKVDYDSNQALREKYGVTLQTTFVEVDDNRDLAKKYVAYNEPTFDSVKENLLGQ